MPTKMVVKGTKLNRWARENKFAFETAFFEVVCITAFYCSEDLIEVHKDIYSEKKTLHYSKKVLVKILG